jgi:hypothetical protein
MTTTVLEGRLLLFIVVVVGIGISAGVGVTTITMSLQTQVYATAGNPKTPEREIMAAPGDPNPQVRQLASGGICAFDDNVKALQEELGSKFTDAMIDVLRNVTYDALNDTATFVNTPSPDNNYDPPDEPIVLGNLEDC